MFCLVLFYLLSQKKNYSYTGKDIVGQEIESASRLILAARVSLLVRVSLGAKPSL